MVPLALTLLVAAVASFSLGVLLWVICIHFWTEHIPKGITHPVRLRILSCLLHLTLTWGMIFEKLGLCYATQFASFLHDLKPLKRDPDIVVTDLRFGTIPVKLYQPKESSSTLRTGIIFFHGGGTVLGSLRTHHNVCLRLSKDCGSVVLAVGYRKSPKYKYPAMKNDCVAATAQFLKSLHVYGVDPSRVVVCGDSVGGNAATVICQLFRNKADFPQIRAQILIYSSLQSIDFRGPSYQQNANIPLLSWNLAFYCCCCHLDVSTSWKSVIKSGTHLPPEVWEKYRKWLGSENIPERFKKRGYQCIPPGPVNEDAYREITLALNSICSPLIAEDDIVSQLPETCIVSCEYDLLRDHSLLYKKRLEDLGVPVTWHHMEDGFHGVLNTLDFGFLSFPCSSRIMDLVAQFIRKL
ncbi:arylacetamide deacetylase-like 3 [Cricetulus griseus]|uniref:Arylacetamide deacetylase-like 3 n=1 Tax=Cricetulus griseus TaxID=10029 RepID=A0A8C2N4H1_CRIGR|nr:arylacetamide deacetylase-like 3 [Cricetulus griseus]XP_027253925.1 arylacetamide deacetylase-like 3 [Cricetulus griseus]